MRFISEDNKVFNTIEECQEHEKSLKENNEKKKQEEFEALRKRYDSLVDQIDTWEEDYTNFIDKWSNSLKKSAPKKDEEKTTQTKNSVKIPSTKYTMDLDCSDFIRFLRDYFN